MLVRLGCAMVLVAMALSGCTSGPDAEPAPVGRIDGAVVDHMLGPWADTEVHLVEMDRWTTTAELGGFSFLDVPPGIHTVAVKTPQGEDRELVVVEAWEISRTILQVWDLPPAQPYVSKLTHRATQQLAEPGAPCDACQWRTNLREDKPVAATLLAVWDPRVLVDVETHLDITIRDQDGNPLADPLGPEHEEIYPRGGRMLRTMIPGDLLEDVQRIYIDVAFSEDNQMPHIDFEMEIFLHLHYGMTEEAKALLA